MVYITEYIYSKMVATPQIASVWAPRPSLVLDLPLLYAIDNMHPKKKVNYKFQMMKHYSCPSNSEPLDIKHSGYKKYTPLMPRQNPTVPRKFGAGFSVLVRVRVVSIYSKWIGITQKLDYCRQSYHGFLFRNMYILSVQFSKSETTPPPEFAWCHQSWDVTIGAGRLPLRE